MRPSANAREPRGRLLRSSDELTNVAVAAIAAGSLSTWSFISAISGDRTSVGSGRSIAASWYVSDLPEPGRHQRERVAAVDRGPHDVLLPGRKSSKPKSSRSGGWRSSPERVYGPSRNASVTARVTGALDGLGGDDRRASSVRRRRPRSSTVTATTAPSATRAVDGNASSAVGAGEERRPDRACRRR